MANLNAIQRILCKSSDSPPHQESPLLAEAATPAQAVKRQKACNFYVLCHRTLDVIRQRDSYGFFLEPVDTTLVPDYLQVIREPMDLSTMERRIQARSYQTLSDFERDFRLIVSNAKVYNAPETIYFKSATRLEAFGSRLLAKESQRIAEGYYELSFEDPGTSEFGSAAYGSSYLGRKDYALSGGDASAAHGLRQRDHQKLQQIYAEEEEPQDEAFYNAIEQEQALLQQQYLANQQAKRFKASLFRRNADGSFAFSSLYQYEPEFYADGSIALEDHQIRQLLITEAMDAYAASSPTIAEALGCTFDQNGMSSTEHLTNSSVQLPAPLLFSPFVMSFAPSYDSSKTTNSLSAADSMLLSLMYADATSRSFIGSMQRFAAETESEFLIKHVEELTNVMMKGIPRLLRSDQASPPAPQPSDTQKSPDSDASAGDTQPPAGSSASSEAALKEISKLLGRLIKLQKQRQSLGVTVHSPDESDLVRRVKLLLTETCSQVPAKELISEVAVYHLYQQMQQQSQTTTNYRGTIQPAD